MKLANFLASAKVENLPTNLPWYLLPTVAGLTAAVLGFFVVMPRTVFEGMGRMVVSMCCSVFFGPILIATAYHWVPWLFQASIVAFGSAQFAEGPFYLIAALPSWWILGWVVRSMEDRKGKDIKDILLEARSFRDMFKKES